MTRLDACTIHVEAAAAATRYYYLIDRERFREGADMFAADASFLRAGKMIHGPDEMFAALNDRSPGQIVRHTVSNLVVDLIAPDRANANYDLSVFIQKAEDQGGALGVPPVSYVRDGTTELRLEDGAWKITKIEMRPVYRT